MATLKNNWLRVSLSLITLLLDVFVFVSAQTSAEPAAAKSAITYYFTSNTLADATDAAAWSAHPQDAQNCDGLCKSPAKSGQLEI